VALDFTYFHNPPPRVLDDPFFVIPDSCAPTEFRFENYKEVISCKCETAAPLNSEIVFEELKHARRSLRSNQEFN